MDIMDEGKGVWYKTLQFVDGARNITISLAYGSARVALYGSAAADVFFCHLRTAKSFVFFSKAMCL